jgi:hypothetical protein
MVDGISQAVPSAEHPPAWEQLPLQFKFKGEKSVIRLVE